MSERQRADVTAGLLRGLANPGLTVGVAREGNA